MNNNNPWLGLRTYKENDKIYGRDKEKAQLANFIKGNLHTIIYGKSGVGKSSLLQAGVFPLLRDEDMFPVYIRLEHNSAKSYFEQIKVAVLAASSFRVEWCEYECDSIKQFLTETSFIDDDIHCRQYPVLVFDQFEEIFMLPDMDHKQDVELFFDQIADILDVEETCFRIVICLREDYLYYLEQNSVRIPDLKRNRFSLRTLNKEQATEIIRKPCNGIVTDVVVECILNKVSLQGFEEYEPAILSLFMYSLFEKMKLLGLEVISKDLVDTFGGNIISDFYNSSTNTISDSSMEFIEEHLLTNGGYRHNIPVDDARKYGVTNEEMNQLIESRIVTIIPRTNNVDYMEFSHDILCPVATKSRNERRQRIQKQKNRRRMIMMMGTAALMIVVLVSVLFLTLKITQNRNLMQKNDNMLRMQSRATAYKVQEDIGDNDYLAYIAALIEVIPDSSNKRPFVGSPIQQLYNIENSGFCYPIRFDTSINIVNKGDTLFVYIGEHGYSWNFENKKLEELSNANKKYNFDYNIKFCDSKNLDSLNKYKNQESFKIIDQRPIYNNSSHNGIKYIKDSINSTVKSTSEDTSSSGSSKYLAKVSADNKIIYVLCNPDDNITHLYNETLPDSIKNETQRNKQTLDASTIRDQRIELKEFGNKKKQEQIRKYASFSSDSRCVVAATDDTTAYIWNTTGKYIGTLRHENHINDAKFSPDGPSVMTVSGGKTVQILDTLGKPSGAPLIHKCIVNAAEFSPNGQYVITASKDSVRIWDIKDTLRKPIKLVCKIYSPSEVNSASFSSTGDSIVTVSDFTVRIWKMSNDSTLIPCDSIIERQRIISSSFSPKGNLLITVSNSIIKIWNVKNGFRICEYIQSDSDFKTASFNSDGRYILTSTTDGMVEIWDIATRECVYVNIGNHISMSPDMKTIAIVKDDEVIVKKFIDHIQIINKYSKILEDSQIFNKDGKIKHSKYELSPKDKKKYFLD